ncbi:MAG: single-stranded DNA-binding protein [Candidatus Omnitrophica bacterium]|nr:single-stranded DNA-binding protein [Candidatus Omnitrophota bacterium]
MASLNRVLLIGNLTKDPELRYTPSGAAVVNLRLAVNSTFKDQAGQRKEETCFLTVVAWGRQAETCNQYLKKGRSVFVEGRLIYRSWEAEGKTRSTMEVRADRVQFLGLPAASGAAQAGGPGGPGGPGRPREEAEPARPEEPEAEAATTEGDAEADVPF